MNNVPNSDSEQCTESKLSRVHSAPTLGLACAHTARALCLVAGLARSCHNAVPRAMSSHPCARCCEPCRSLPDPVARTTDRIVAVSPAVSQPVSRYNLAAKPPSCHDTPIRIATQSPNSQALARAKSSVEIPFTIFSFLFSFMSCTYS